MHYPTKILLSVIALLSLTGCESTGIVHDKNYLQAVSVGGTDEKKLSFAFFSTEDSVITVSGEDMTEAKQKAELKSGKKIVTGYTEIVILDDTVSSETLEFLLHDWKVSPSCMIVCGEDGERLLDEIPAQQLKGMVERAVEQKKAPECDIITVLGNLLSKDKSAEIAEINADGTVGRHQVNIIDQSHQSPKN